MILDNENENHKVHEWISEYTEQGKLDIITGYFTIGALAWLSKKVNSKISEFRLVFGDIVNFDLEDNRPLDLLKENICIEAALKLNSLSQEVVKPRNMFINWFDLIYINYSGEAVLVNQKEVLDAITYHKDKDRFVPDAIDKGDEIAIRELVQAMKSYLDKQSSEVVEGEDGTSKKLMGKEAKDILAKSKSGDKSTLERIKQNVTVDEKYSLRISI
jgi:hypothetical protein